MKAITGDTGPIEGSYFDFNSYFGGGGGGGSVASGRPETSTVLNAIAIQPPTPQSLVASHLIQQTSLPIMASASGQFFHFLINTFSLSSSIGDCTKRLLSSFVVRPLNQTYSLESHS